LSAQCAAYN